MKKFLLFFLLSLNAFAHEGRAYLLFEHKKIGKNEVSLRVDPDKEKGTFEFFIEGNPAEEMTIELQSSPTSDPSHVLKATALKDADASSPPGRLVYKAIFPFDRVEQWNFDMTFKQNEDILNTSKELVEVVEPGPNKKEFLLFFLPFSLVGFLGIKVFLAKRK